PQARRCRRGHPQSGFKSTGHENLRTEATEGNLAPTRLHESIYDVVQLWAHPYFPGAQGNVSQAPHDDSQRELSEMFEAREIGTSNQIRQPPCHAVAECR